jgi:PAS domain S-box-containing protein
MSSSVSSQRTKELLLKVEELQNRLDETEETLSAIHNGKVDAIVVSGTDGDKVFSLISSDTPYRTIIEYMDEGAVTVSSEGIILYSNHRFSEIILRPAEKVTGSAFTDFISESDRHEFKRLLRISHKKPMRGEVTSRVNGKDINLGLSLVSLPASMDNSVCIIVSDITEISNYQNYLQEMIEERTSLLRMANHQLSEDLKKIIRAEKKLKESEERYRLLSDTMLQGVIYRNSDGIIISINPAAEKILGRSADQIIGQKSISPGMNTIREDESFFPESEHPEYIALEKAIPVSGVVMGVFNTALNSYRWISIDTMPLFRKGGNKPYQLYSMFEDITERKLTEKELIKREEIFRTAFDKGAIAMTMAAPDGSFIKVNNSFCKLTGYSEKELSGMSFQHLTYPGDLDSSLKGKDDLNDGKIESFRIEKRYLRKDGKIIWVNISSAPVRDEKGNLEFFVAHIQDISKRKSAETRLKDSKEKFKQLANSIPQLAWIARSDGYIFWFNQRWYEYTGTRSEEVIGWEWKKALDPVYEGRIIDQWKSFISAGKPFENILSLADKKGNYREFLTKCIPIKDRNGNVEQWFGTNTDISQLKKIERELKNSRKKLNIALENGNIGTWEWNIKTNGMTWDERAGKMFDLHEGSIEETFVNFENNIHEEDLSHVRKAIRLAFEKNHSFETILRTRPKNGNYNYISIKGLISKDREGKPLSMSGVCFDVTGMKQGTEKLLIRMNEELLRSNTDLQQFAYVASHDLQEPLRMVSSFTQLLQKKYYDKLDEDGLEYIRYAVEGSKRMYDLLNGLLAYSRIQSRGKEFSRVNMNEVLMNVRQNLSLVIEESAAIIRNSELPVIYADESQMIQLVQNLMENSIKFRKGRPEIQVSSKIENEFHVFSISDKGIGIDQQYFERIFKIFQRLHRSEEYEGTGIGLAICKRIVERHGGRIWVESEAGQGSTFYFSIPLIIINTKPEN